MRKVIIIDNNRIGLFDLLKMEAEEISKTTTENTYHLNIRHDEVIESKSLVKKIEKAIRRRRAYDNKKYNR